MLFVLVFGILFFAVLGFFSLLSGLLGLRLRSLVRRVAAEGRITEGRVSDLRRTGGSPSRHRQPHYYATVAYLVEGQRYESVLRISQRHYDLWTKETPVQIQYLPSEPKLSFLLADRTEQRGAIGALVGAGVLFAAAVGMLILMVLALLALGSVSN